MVVAFASFAVFPKPFTMKNFPARGQPLSTE